MRISTGGIHIFLKFGQFAIIILKMIAWIDNFTLLTIVHANRENISCRGGYGDQVFTG